ARDAMRIAVLTPLPPVRSGIAGYAALLLPHLAARAEVVAVVDQERWDPVGAIEVVPVARFAAMRSSFDAVIGQLGNNPYHDFVWGEAMERPLHAVLHDFVLHHLVVERTLAKGNAAEYEAIVAGSDGAAGAAFARGRSRGYHAELGNFLFPASSDLAARSKGVIVHNRWAGEELRRRGVETPIVVVGHPFDAAAPLPTDAERARVRSELGFTAEHRVIGMFGFVTGAKRPEAVFAAFGRARAIDPSLRLLIVGAPAPNVDLDALAAAAALPAESWKKTGYVADEAFDGYLAAVDRVVNLRYPSAGEMSGPLIRAFRLGRPVAVSELAQFAEIPRDVVVHVAPTAEEIPALVSFMTRPIDAGALASAQRRWLDEHASMERVVGGYMRALAGENDIPERMVSAPASLPLVPRLSVRNLAASVDRAALRVSFDVANEGEERYRAAAYGEPALRFVAKAWSGDAVVGGRWVAPTRDLGRGDEMTLEIDLPIDRDADRVTIELAISDVPLFQPRIIASTPVGA
ncbi:MAG TPA: glycosyltransferase, partial [Thermoanaerobaculia bacterium]